MSEDPTPAAPNPAAPENTPPRAPLKNPSNWLVAALVVGALGYGYHQRVTSTPEYKAGATVERAQGLETSGNLLDAVRAYVSLAEGPRRADGLAALQRLLAGPLREGPLGEALTVIVKSAYAAEVLTPETTTELIELAVARVEKDPKAALALLTTLRPLAQAEVDRHRERVLTLVVKQEPKNADAVSGLALILEARGEAAQAEPMLKAVGEGLARTEGARILGQLLAARGEIDAAHALLLPYVEERLDTLTRAEKVMRQALRRAQQGAIKLIREGKAPAKLQERLLRMNKTQQAAAQRDFVLERIKQDAKCLETREAFRKASTIVPVALDLGLVKLQRAQRLTDKAARRKELKAAESLFLSVQTVAGRSLAYRINLGKVCHWLGKEQDGRQLFEEVLTNSERAPASLLAVANALREVGATREARILSEEAYEKAPAGKLKHHAASFRSLLAHDLDDEVAWLGKADPKDLRIAARLSSARGRKAGAAGDAKGARRHLRAAIEAYGKLPESASTLNNAALAHQTLYGFTGELDELGEYLRKLQRAEGLAPSDPILMANVAAALTQSASQAVVGKRLQLSVLRLNPGTGLIPFLYDDERGRKRVDESVYGHPDLQAALERLRKLQVLVPKQPDAHYQLLQLLRHRPDVAAHRALLSAVQAAQFDLEGLREQARQAYEKPIEAKDRAAFRESLASLTQALARARKRGHRPTLALALSRRVEAQLAGRILGLSVRGDAIVAQAEEAVRLAPTQGSRAALIAALLARASERLVKTQPGFRAMRQRSRRSLSTGSLIAEATHDPALRQAVVSDPDVRRAAKLVRERGARLPSSRSAWDWALLRWVEPQAAEQVAAFLAKDEIGTLRRKIARLLSPLRPEPLLSAVWELRARGQDAAAKKALQEAATRKVPLPYDPS